MKSTISRRFGNGLGHHHHSTTVETSASTRHSLSSFFTGLSIHRLMWTFTTRVKHFRRKSLRTSRDSVWRRLKFQSTLALKEQRQGLFFSVFSIVYRWFHLSLSKPPRSTKHLGVSRLLFLKLSLLSTLNGILLFLDSSVFWSILQSRSQSCVC